jgi:hypothetical protein
VSGGLMYSASKLFAPAWSIPLAIGCAINPTAIARQMPRPASTAGNGSFCKLVSLIQRAFPGFQLPLIRTTNWVGFTNMSATTSSDMVVSM